MAKKKRKKEKPQIRHGCTMTIQTPMEIPWNAKEGVQLRITRGDRLLGEIVLTGAGVSARKADKQTWFYYTFIEVMERLTA